MTTTNGIRFSSQNVAKAKKGKPQDIQSDTRRFKYIVLLILGDKNGK